MDTPLPPVALPTDRATLVERVNTALPDNLAQAISPEDIRSRLVELIESCLLSVDYPDIGPTFGTAAYANVGTAGHVLGHLDTLNTWTGLQAFTTSPTAPTPAAGDNSSKLATTGHLAGNYATLEVDDLAAFQAGRHPWSPAVHVLGGPARGLWIDLPAIVDANRPLVTDADGRLWGRPEIEFPRGPALWELAWWFPQHSTTLDQTALVQKAINAYDPSVREVVLRLPPMTTMVLGSSVPLNLNGKHRLTIEGSHSSVFSKTVPNKILIAVGNDDQLVTEISFRGFTLDGNNVVDTNNDFPLLFVYAGDIVRMQDLRAVNGGTGLRVGRGQTTPPSKKVWVERCQVHNMAWHGIEMFNVDRYWIEKNTMVGGAAGVGDSNRAIRLLQGTKGWVTKNQIDGYGGGVVLDSDAGNYQEQIWIEDNSIVNSVAPNMGAIWSYYSTRDVTIARNYIKNAAAPCGILIGQINNADRSQNLRIIDNTIVWSAGTTRLMDIREVDGGQISGNRLRHVGSGLASPFYAIRLDDCGGFIDIKDNLIEMDGGATANPCAILDNAGLASLRLQAAFNTIAMPTGSTQKIVQSGSAGTLVKGNGASDSNIYIAT